MFSLWPHRARLTSCCASTAFLQVWNLLKFFGGDGNNVSIEIIFRNGWLCIVLQSSCCWKWIFQVHNHIRVSKVVKLSASAKCPLPGMYLQIWFKSTKYCYKKNETIYKQQKLATQKCVNCDKSCICDKIGFIKAKYFRPFQKFLTSTAQVL